MMFIRNLAVSTSLLLALLVGGANAQLENHYTFDNKDDFGADASGKGRDAEVEDLGGITWVMDERRGSGVIELPGGNADYLFAELPEDGLPADFTIAFWALRDDALCCEPSSGANDGFFQVQLDTGGVSTGEKIVGGWVQKTTDAVWGRVREDDDGFINQINLDQASYFMENDDWTHFAYRSTSIEEDVAEFEIVVDGESGEGPLLEYGGILDFHDQIIIGKQGTETWGGRLDDFRVYSTSLTDEEIKEIMGGAPMGEVGDYNVDGQLDVLDIDLQSAEMKKDAADQDLAKFDHNEDNKVDIGDRTIWVKDLKKTWMGDSNFDNEFNSGDLVDVFAAGKYETGETAGWAAGDWDGDMQFGSSDLVLAFSDGGYEQGPPPAAAVPEPCGLVLLSLAGLMMLPRRRRRVTLA